MAKNLLGKLRRNEGIDSIHELAEAFIVVGVAMDIEERIKERYQKVKQAIKKLYDSFFIRRY
jgi:hypothetical protein